MTETLTLDSIRTDGGTQPRAYLNELVISEYREAMANGVDFPPVVVFYDGSHYWLADGFHRFFAAKKYGTLTLPADVRQGMRREAILYAAGANATHGLRRTNADKRRAVRRLLDDEEWQGWSDREIARQCGVTHSFVGKLRKTLLAKSHDDGMQPYRTKHGTAATMDTTSMGRTEPGRGHGEAETPGQDPMEITAGAPPADDDQPGRPLVPEEVTTPPLSVVAPLFPGEPAGLAWSLDRDTTHSPPATASPQPLQVQPHQPKKQTVEEVAAASGQTPAEWMAELLAYWLLDLENTYDGITLAMVQQATERLVTQYQQARQEIAVHAATEAAATPRTE